MRAMETAHPGCPLLPMPEPSLPPGSNGIGELNCTSSRIGPNLMLPDDLDIKASRPEGGDDFVISMGVPLELPPPELSVGCGQIQRAAGTSVPIAAVDEHGEPGRGKVDVWATW